MTGKKRKFQLRSTSWSDVNVLVPPGAELAENQTLKYDFRLSGIPQIGVVSR